MPRKINFQPVPDDDVMESTRSIKSNANSSSSSPKRKEKQASPIRNRSSPDRSKNNKSPKKNNNSSPIRNLSFRVKKSPERRSFLAQHQNADDSAALEEMDPVMSLFQARTKQRVRFCLEEGPPQPQQQNDSSSGPASPHGSIKKFMTGALFGKPGSARTSEEFEAEVAKEIESAKNKDPEMVWESPQKQQQKTAPVKTQQSVSNKNKNLSLKFVEDSSTKAAVTKLLNKARRATYVHYRYEYAVKCHVRASELLRNYPDDHPTLLKVMDGLHQAHLALSSYKNSANIVKMGMKYEDTGELVRALKMYTIAYRIRRDHLSRSHPSLIVLLNMLGSIQMKRGELEEAMQIYELALKDGPVPSLEPDTDDQKMQERQPFYVNLLTRSVTYREMGTIYEAWGESDTALEMYHRSLKCIAEYKGLTNYKSPLDDSDWDEKANMDDSAELEDEAANEQQGILDDLEGLRLSRSFVRRTEVVSADHDRGTEASGMELLIGLQRRGKRKKGSIVGTFSSYDVFFPPSIEPKIKKKGTRGKKRDGDEDFSDVDAALTLHQIAQLHRAKGEFNLALAAYNVSLRGMKFALGKYHPNVAAILGNIGNLRKEMGDMDAAFETYQQVLAIESYRLGLSHPDVTVTLHNIATIDAARGNHQHALSLYKQVLSLQRKLFGDSEEPLAVTSACMGDVYERIGDLSKASDCYEEALRIKMMTLGRNSLEVARLFHKLGKLAIAQKEFQLAYTCVSKAILIYRLNHLAEEDEWMVDANRDGADIDAAIALGQGTKFETRFEC